MTPCPVCGKAPEIKTSHNTVWLRHEVDCQLKRVEQYVTAQDAEFGWRKTIQYYMQRNLRSERKTYIDQFGRDE